MSALGHEQKVIRRKGSFTSTPTQFGERIKDSRNWLSILVRLVNVEIDSAQGFRGVGLLCLCIVGLAVVIAPLELVAYPILKSIGCSLTEEQQTFTCGDDWAGQLISTVLNLPIRFSDAREFSFGARASFGRDFTIYLFDAIFVLALAYLLTILFTWRAGRRSS